MIEKNPNSAQISQAIASNDGMYQGNLVHYLQVGESALQAIHLALAAARRDPQTIASILDLPCGYGRVLRWLLACWPGRLIAACDLNREGVDFCAQTFHALPVYSHAEPEHIRMPGNLDLIWCGSLLTHLPASCWLPWLQNFARWLTPQGVVVFTTHGRTVLARFDQGVDYGLPPGAYTRLRRGYHGEGFGFISYHAHEPHYGFSLARPSWVLAQVEQESVLQLVSYREAGWDDHQDVVACIKTREVPPA